MDAREHAAVTTRSAYRDVLAEGYESVAAAALDRAKDSKIVAEGGAR